MSRRIIYLQDLVSFIRLPNLLMIFSCLWLIRLFLFHPVFKELHLTFSLDAHSYLLYTLDVCLVAVCGYWINDWHDRKVDAINKPHRLLVKLDISTPLFWSLLLSALFLGLAITFRLAVNTGNLDKIWIFPLSIVILSAYAYLFNRMGLVGNILISLMVSLIPGLAVLTELPILFNADLVQSASIKILLRVLVQVSLLLFLANLSREILKDFEDLEGDQSVGSKSLIIRYGLKKAKQFVIIIIGLLSLCELWFIVGGNSTISVALAAIIIFMTIGLMIMTFKSDEQAQFSRLSFLMLVVMMIGMAQMATVYLNEWKTIYLSSSVDNK